MEVSTSTIEKPETAVSININHERCDVCTHRAYVVIEIAGLPLAFCNHHFTHNEPALIASGAAILVDVRSLLTERSVTE